MFEKGQLVRVKLPKMKDFADGRLWNYTLGTVIEYHEKVGSSETPAYEVLVDGEKKLFRESSLRRA